MKTSTPVSNNDSITLAHADSAVLGGQRLLFCLALVAGFVTSAAAQSITYKGTHFDMGTGWRTASVTKNYGSSAVTGDNVMGLNGYFVWGNNQRSQMPAYVSAMTPSTAVYGGNGSYASIDDPSTTPGATPSTLVTGTTVNGQTPFRFTVNDSMPSTIRLGVMIDGMDGANWNPDTVWVQTSTGAVTSGNIAVSSAANANYKNRIPDWLFFDISAIAAGSEIQVYCSGGSGGANCGVQAVAFDSQSSPQANINSFSIQTGGQTYPGTIAATADPLVGAITVYVPEGTNVTSALTSFTLSSGATSVPASGTSLDLTTPASITVTSANDGVNPVIVKRYDVTVLTYGAESTVIWNLTTGGAWDTTTANWAGEISNASMPFTNGQNVIFNKTGGGTIAVAADMQPAAINVTATSGTYTFSGGPISGDGSLVKSGGGTLVLSSANSYSGGTTLTAGSLLLSNNAALGSGRLTINGGQFGSAGGERTIAGNIPITLNESFTHFNSAANTNFGGGDVTLAKPITITVSNSISFGGPITGPGGLNAFDITFSHMGGTTYGVTLGGAIVLHENQTATMDGWGTSINGVISDGGNGYGFTKMGAGTIVLNATNTYTGDTVVNAGSLTLGSGGSMKFKPRANGVSNKLTSSAGTPPLINLNGKFEIDLSQAELRNGNTWLLVDTDHLNETYGGSFAVTGWAPSGSDWVLIDGDRTWTFNKTAGTLSLVAPVSGYATWIGTFEGLADPAPDADPDADGLANSIEYMLGTNPGTPNAGGPDAEVTGDNLVVKFSRSDESESPDLTLVAEVSTDLLDWTTLPSYPIGASSEGNVNVSENGTNPDTITVTIPKNGEGKKFVRLRAIIAQ